MQKDIVATYEMEASGEPKPQSKRPRDDDTEICNRQRQKITVHGGPAGPEATDDEDSHDVAKQTKKCGEGLKHESKNTIPFCE